MDDRHFWLQKKIPKIYTARMTCTDASAHFIVCCRKRKQTRFLNGKVGWKGSKRRSDGRRYGRAQESVRGGVGSGPGESRENFSIQPAHFDLGYYLRHCGAVCHLQRHRCRVCKFCSLPSSAALNFLFFYFVMDLSSTVCCARVKE